jgi:hypothetical protein
MEERKQLIFIYILFSIVVYFIIMYLFRIITIFLLTKCIIKLKQRIIDNLSKIKEDLKGGKDV